MKKNICCFALIIILFHCNAWGDLLTTAELQKLGVNPSLYHIDRWSQDNKILFGLQKIVNPVVIQKMGRAFELVLLYFDKQKFIRSEFLPLPIRQFHQVSFLENSKIGLLVSEKGTNFYKIDLMKRQVTHILGHKKGEPGFRMADPLIYVNNGKFYVYGYFYDENNGTDGDTYLVSVNLAKTGVDIFEKVLSTKEVREVLGISTFATYIPPDIAIWGVRRPQDGLLELKSYDKITPKLLDTGIGFTGVVCAGTRIFYVAKKPGKVAQWNAVVKDLVTNELWFVGDKDKSYTYPFISTDGSTVALSLFDFEKKNMSLYYAKRKENFLLKPINKLQNVDLGSFRPSPDGKVFAFYSSKGILVDEIK